MKPGMTEADFGVLARRTGIPLSAEQIATLYEAQGWVEAMLETLHRPRAPEVEPAHVFAPEVTR